MALKFTLFFTVFSLFLFSFQPSQAKEFNNDQALSGLSQVKVYFDMKTATPQKLENRLMWISDTHDKLVKNGVKTEFVIGFRNQASYYVTKGDDYVFEEELAIKEKIHSWIKKFKKLGMVMEQCAISARLYDIEPEDFFPEIQVVQSSYVSIIAYQAKGYALFPMY